LTKKLFNILYNTVYRGRVTMASKKSRRRRSNPETKKSPLEKKEVKIGIFIIAIIVIVAIAAAILMSGGNDNGSNNEEIGNPIAVFDTTIGDFRIELFEDKTPWNNRI